MITKELLVKYRKLKMMDSEAAYQLFLENESNERFVSLVKTCDDFSGFTREFIEGDGDILNEKSYKE